MDTITLCLILIPALPLLAAIVVGLLGEKVLREASHWPVILAIGSSFIFSLLLVVHINFQTTQLTSDSGGYEKVVTLWTWANVKDAYDLKPAVPNESAPADAKAS